jgi:hypothetical protein
MKARWKISNKPALFRVGLVLLSLAPLHIFMMMHFVSLRNNLISSSLYEAAHSALLAATIWYTVGLFLNLAALVLCCFGQGGGKVAAITAGGALIVFTPRP